MVAETTQTRRWCPRCGVGVKAAWAEHEHPRQCPSCKATVVFYDTTIPPLVPPQRQDDEFWKGIFIAALAGLGLATITAFVSAALSGFALEGLAEIAIILIGFGGIAFAIFQFRRIVTLHADIHELDYLKPILHEATTKYYGLHKNYAAIINQANQALQQAHAEAMAIIEDANRQAAATDAAMQDKHAAVLTVSKRYLADMAKIAKEDMTARNFASVKKRLEKVIEFCRKAGLPVSKADEEAAYHELKEAYHEAVRKEEAMAEQRRIREKIREEQKLEREVQKAVEDAERQRRAIEEALKRELAKHHDEHSAQVEELKKKLAEVEARAQRAISMAQQTKAGYVYVISNIGSFGEDVFKIGMSRRLDPLDRIFELGDASVPFPFDVHMMISCNDAPKLENILHNAFAKRRINKVNLRKEFFRVSLEEIAAVVKRNHGEVEYQADPIAFEYRESLTMTDEDAAFVASEVATIRGDDED